MTARSAGSIIAAAILVAMVFVPAGSLAYWRGWLWLGVVVVSAALYLARLGPDALTRRRNVGAEADPAQRRIVAGLLATMTAIIVLSPIGWLPVPWWASIIGCGLTGLAFVGYDLVGRANPYASANIGVEAEQQLAEDGVYGWVRHPMYASGVLFAVGTMLTLGSLAGLVLMPVYVVLVRARILREERVLARDLPGYEAYQRRVRHRLLPGLW